jgi:N-formylglutamate deformylase
MQHPAFDIHLPPERLSAVVMASPHSGRDYPASLIQSSQLNFAQLRSSEDAFVDRLIDMAPDHGAALITARCPRAYVDFNRAPDEFDPALIEGLTRSLHNPRISSGLGVIPRVVSGGKAIYRGKIPLSEAESRIASNWHPYHRALRNLLEETHRMFGHSVLIDWHSMPHEAIANHGRPAPNRSPRHLATRNCAGRPVRCVRRGGMDRPNRSGLSGCGPAGCAKFALCRGLHRPKLWPPHLGAACDSDRN